MLKWNEIDTAKAYSQERAALLVLLEGSTLAPYVDSVGDPTIGIGFNLVYNLEPVLRVIIGKQNWSDALLRKLEVQIDKSYAPNSSSSLIANLNAVMADWHNTRDSDVPAEFRFKNDAQIAKALDALAPTYDSKIDNWLSGIPESQEREALFSLCWNGPSLLGPKLKAAIEDGNRAEAWYEIRYNSNGNGISGLANRRYVEAETFGLFDKGDTASWKEAVKASQTLSSHHQSILAYEAKYDPETAGEIKGVAGIEAMSDEMAPAIKAALKHLGLATNISIEELLSASATKANVSGDDTSNDNAKNDDDMILGTNGANQLSGNAGADVLAGLKGADALAGGAGADLFVFTGSKDSTPGTFDTITDFGNGADRIALTGFGDLEFLSKKNAAFTGAGLEIHFLWSGGNTVVEVDVDGDRSADVKIVLAGQLSLDQSDFLL